MTDDELLAGIDRSFQSAMNVSFKPGLKMDEVEEWDSLAHTQLMMALEEEFGIQFQFEDVIRMISGTAVIDAVRATIARQPES